MVLKDYIVKEYWTSLLSVEDPFISDMTIPKYRFVDSELLYLCTSFGCKGHAFGYPLDHLNYGPDLMSFKVESLLQKV